MIKLGKVSEETKSDKIGAPGETAGSPLLQFV